MRREAEHLADEDVRVLREATDADAVDSLTLVDARILPFQGDGIRLPAVREVGRGPCPTPCFGREVERARGSRARTRRPRPRLCSLVRASATRSEPRRTGTDRGDSRALVTLPAPVGHQREVVALSPTSSVLLFLE